MCGVIRLGEQRIFVDCEVVRPPWWPPIDFTRFTVTDEPDPGAWRAELTFLGQVLAGVAVLRDPEVSQELGRVTAELGSRIAAKAGVDVAFEFDAHREVRAG
jgi:hypothetical protein